MAEKFNTKCIIESNVGLGRYVKAKEKVVAGELVLLEKPIIIMSDHRERRCGNCYKLAENYCGRCNITNLCFQCTEHNESDCNLLASMTNVDWNVLKQQTECYDIIKCLLLQENPETRNSFELMLQAESHLEQRRNTKIWQHCKENVVEPILKSGIGQAFFNCSENNEDFLQRLCGIIEVNGFEIRAPDKGSLRGIYINGALLSHDCTANTQFSIDNEYSMRVYANRNIDEGVPITNCYTNVLLVS